MRPPAVIVPVKSAGRKSRLSGVLDRHEREEFAALLLAAVLGAIRSARLLPSCYVVSSDEMVLDLASRAGANTVPEPEDAGVNSAVARGLHKAKNRDALVIPGDLPLLRPSELKGLLAGRGEGVDVALAPSRAFDGTNALLFSPSSRLRLSYDDDSFWNHLSGAASETLTVRVCTEPGLMFDVDSEEDFRDLALSQSSRPPARYARERLR